MTATGRRLVAALACRNQGSRLYGKPLQNLDVDAGISILDNIIECLKTIASIDEIVLGISEGVENEVFKDVAERHGLQFIIGDQRDVLSRLIQCGHAAHASDIFRVTTESPFPTFDQVDALWREHVQSGADATFFDEIVDGCGFEILTLDALERSHRLGDHRHRSELCTLYMREHREDFRIETRHAPASLNRKDLRLTVDQPHDLIVCRAVYAELKRFAPRIPIEQIVAFLDTKPHLVELIAPFTEQGYSTMYL
jgi:spore coat polysaccharide biosynthesis protein SpsF